MRPPRGCGRDEADATPEVIERIVEVPTEWEGPEVPFLEMWQDSGHADAEAEAFIHWDEDDPAVVSSGCAKCHSTYGFQEFLGLDGSEFGVVENDAEIGSVIECVACHNDVTSELTSVVMPSGAEITGLGDESRCMNCHQGRESTVSVNEALTEVGVGDPDEVTRDNAFIDWTPRLLMAVYNYQYVMKDPGGFAHNGQYIVQLLYDSLNSLRSRVSVDMAGMARP